MPKESTVADTLKTFQALLLDADGVWFDGYESRAVLPDGRVQVLKRRHYHDGQGLSFIRSCGVRIFFVSGEGEPLESIVEKLNALPSVLDGTWAPVELAIGKKGRGDKVAAIETWLTENKISWNDCVYIGDDINDYAPMSRVSDKGGLVVAPANATRCIVDIADIVLTRAGGHGAIREFAEMVLDARGIDERALPPS